MAEKLLEELNLLEKHEEQVLFAVQNPIQTVSAFNAHMSKRRTVTLNDTLDEIPSIPQPLLKKNH